MESSIRPDGSMHFLDRRAAIAIAALAAAPSLWAQTPCYESAPSVPPQYAVGSLPYAVALADVDGDGILDLVVANWNSNDVSVMRGLGDGSFAAQTLYPTGKNPSAIAI